MIARALLSKLLASAVLGVVLSALITAAAPAAPRCYGAAARDALNPCADRTLSVFPAPDDVANEGPDPCALTTQAPEPICTFGTSRARAVGDVALVGDSHALHWRPALAVVARAMRWRGHSMTAPACFYSDAVDKLPAGLRESCVEWYAAARAWFAEHPEIGTVFVSQAAPTPVTVLPGTTYVATKVAGFRAAWDALPANVKHVVVIRDVPGTSQENVDCVKRVMAGGTERPGPACAYPRIPSLRWDTAVTAVTQLRSPRFQYVDMTPFFCGSKLCYPVVGGVMVHSDVWGHITGAYSRTLGPYLLRKVRALAKRWRGRPAQAQRQRASSRRMARSA